MNDASDRFEIQACLTNLVRNLIHSASDESHARECAFISNEFCSQSLTHLLVLVRVDGGVPHGAPEPRRAAGRPHLALRVGVLPREAEVEHEDVSHGRRGPPHRKVGRLDVPVQEAHVVDGLYSLEDLKGREGLSYMPYLINNTIWLLLAYNWVCMYRARQKGFS